MTICPHCKLDNPPTDSTYTCDWCEALVPNPESEAA